MSTNTLELVIKAQDYASKELKKINKQVKWMQWTFRKTSKSISDFWNRNAETFKKIWIGVWVAVTAVWVMGKQFLDLWTQIQQTQAKANIVFWDYIWDVKKVAQETATAMWLSQNEYLNAAAWIQDLLIPMWFLRGEASVMSTDLVWLAGALSEWSAWQYTAQQTSEILAKAMLWETEQLKSMWIQVDISSKQFNERIKTAAADRNITLQQAKALDIQKQIFEKSTDAQERFKEWWDSLVRQQKELAAKIKNTRDSIAIALIPAMNQLLKEITPVTEELAKNTEEWLKNEKNAKKFEDTMKSAIIVIKLLWKFLKLLVDSWLIVWQMAWYVITDMIIKLSRLKEMWPKMYEWGVNAIKMFTNWISDWIDWLANVMELWAQTIADYLWFHSPTKKWPWSDADKWIPNLMNMLSKGFENWTSDIKKAVNRVSQWIKDSFKLEELQWVLQVIQVDAIATFNNMWNSIASQKDKVNWLYQEYKNLSQQIKDIDISINWIKSEWLNELATRAVDLENSLTDVKKEIAWLTEDSTDEERKLLTEKQKQLQAELDLSKTRVTDNEIQSARIELEKTQTQKIIDRMNARIAEAEEEKVRIQELMVLKKEEIRSEFEVHKAMVEAKIVLEQQYFDLFSSRIKKQQSEVQSVILKMKELLALQGKSSWSSVTEWVWSNSWPQVFNPNWWWIAGSSTWWSVNINLWGVTVNNEADENRLVGKLKKALINEAKLFNLWIS